MEDLSKIVMTYLEDCDGHGFDHTNRVLYNALKIAEYEHITNDVLNNVIGAVLLHDIARPLERKDKSICHAEEGAKLAEPILRNMGVSHTNTAVICEAIRTHRYRSGIPARTIVGRILQEADRLDAMGSIIIGRVIEACISHGYDIYDPNVEAKDTYDGSYTTGINHLKEKILQIKPTSFHTYYGKREAQLRYHMVQDFIIQYEEQYNNIGMIL